MTKKKLVKVANIRTGKILELTEVAIANLKKMGKFSDYDILPEPITGIPVKEVLPESPVINPVPESVPEPTSLNEEDPTPYEEPKKKKKNLKKP